MHFKFPKAFKLVYTFETISPHVSHHILQFHLTWYYIQKWRRHHHHHGMDRERSTFENSNYLFPLSSCNNIKVYISRSLISKSKIILLLFFFFYFLWNYLNSNLTLLEYLFLVSPISFQYLCIYSLLLTSSLDGEKLSLVTTNDKQEDSRHEGKKDLSGREWEFLKKIRKIRKILWFIWKVWFNVFESASSSSVFFGKRETNIRKFKDPTQGKTWKSSKKKEENSLPKENVKKQKVNLKLVKQSDIEIDYLSRQCVLWGF